jgi:hypothetical protein
MQRLIGYQGSKDMGITQTCLVWWREKATNRIMKGGANLRALRRQPLHQNTKQACYMSWRNENTHSPQGNIWMIDMMIKLIVSQVVKKTCLSWKMNVHYHVHNSLPLDQVLSWIQLTPLHHSFNINFNIRPFLSSMLIPNWPLSFRFSD